MAKFFKKSVEKGLNAMFLRVLSPKNNGKDNKVVPDLLLDDERILYLPTTDAGSKCDWTFKSKDVALNDEDSFPSLENTLNEDLKNVFFIHGFYESVDSMSVRNVLNGLDPAGPLFKWKIIRNSEICKNDATFVDIIHTAMSRFGMRGKCGDVDFYPNGGLCFQPGCKRSYSLSVLDSKRLCSHWRCWRYFVESLTREDAFLAAAADSWEDFKKGNTRDVIPMGYCTPPDSSGSYFLQTSDRSPYGKGEDGLKYTDVTCK
ncbi:pancreatic lipase-related protein 3 isoform X5 [Halyomorpha halys]|uniref:pancreatic lipase-related protein 3 isoform X5 n=1 Tax=Halyomorpha halys TaxID=286706 RepID=UPI0034D35970